MHFFYFQVPNPKIVIFPYFLVKICASQKTAALNGLQPSNSNRQASFWKTMSACSQIFLGYVHGGIVAIQPPKSLSTKPNAPFLASTLLAAIQNLPLDEVRLGHGSGLKETSLHHLPKC